MHILGKFMRGKLKRRQLSPLPLITKYVKQGHLSSHIEIKSNQASLNLPLSWLTSGKVLFFTSYGNVKKNYLRTGTDDEEVLKGNCLRSICEEGQEKGDAKYRN